MNPSEDEIKELKAYVEGVLHGKIIMEQMGKCEKCKKYDDLRNGLCFDCTFPICILKKCNIYREEPKIKAKRIDAKYETTGWQYEDSEHKVHCTRKGGTCY